MIVELFGLPGSGKTFYCNELREKKKYRDIMTFYKEKFFGKVIFHLILIFGMIKKEFRKTYNDLIDIIGTDINKKNWITKEAEMNIYIKYIVIIYFIEKNSKNLVIDEGIIHYCMVLFAEYELDKEQCFKIIEYFDNKYFKDKKCICNINCNIDIALSRMKNRNRKRAPIDFLSDDKLIILLERYEQFIGYIKNKYTIIDISELLN
ncbi:MAG: hypothetical protein HFJ55_03900 [Clostridia bacterium]|nr:hypothetical protein [Clostridia bacterium]